MNKPKPTKKGQKGRPRKSNSKHPSHELDNDVGHEVENLLEEQDSNISEEQDEIEGGQYEANTTIVPTLVEVQNHHLVIQSQILQCKACPLGVRNFLLTGEQ